MAGKMWSNLAKPVIRENYNKYKRELSEYEIILFEHLAGDVLAELGYKIDYENERNKIELSSKDVEIFDSENKRLKDTILKDTNSTDLKRRLGQKKLLDEIKTRSLLAVF